MKPFCFLLCLLLIAFIKSEDYTSDTLVNYLKDNGYYNFLTTVKKNFGSDIAISLCKEFVETHYCEEVVKVYIILPNPKPYPPGYSDTTQSYDLEDIFMLYYNELKQHMTDEQIRYLINKYS